MKSFNIVIRDSANTNPQRIKANFIDRLLTKLAEQTDGSFEAMVDVHKPWFNYGNGLIKNTTQNWDTSPNAEVNLCIKTRSLTMEDIHQIMLFLRSKKE